MKPDLASRILDVLETSPDGLSSRRVCQQVGRSWDTARPVLIVLRAQDKVHRLFDVWHFGPVARITYRGDENLAAMQKHSLETTS